MCKYLVYVNKRFFIAFPNICGMAFRGKDAGLITFK